jgi:pimeloyl-ACP methyl ester carboxylesterase
MACFTVVGALLGMSVAPAQAASPQCQAVRLPVALATGQPAEYTIAGTLCVPTRWAPGPRTLDVLTPGGTYNSKYWDWSYDDPSQYSFVRKDVNTGRATFDYDRIGTGDSSHPLPALVTIPAEAYVLHKIVQWAHWLFPKVNTIGHSYGSMVTVEEAGVYRDVDGVVITGMLHLPNVGTGLAGAVASLYPANLDPAFKGRGFDPGYLTTRPGTRGDLFYNRATADASVIAHDEAHKDVVAEGAVASLATTYSLPAPLNASSRITAPVLLVVGTRDGAFCAVPDGLYCANGTALRAFEAPYYLGASSLNAEVVPGSGHDLTLHRTANVNFDIIHRWLNR